MQICLLCEMTVDRLHRQSERRGLDDNLLSTNERKMEARFCVTRVM